MVNLIASCISLQRSIVAAVRIILCASLFVTASNTATAQSWNTPDTCTVTDALLAEYLGQDILAPNEVINGLGRFWEIKSADGAVSHLWGTFHSSERQYLDLPPRVLSQIAAAQVVATEIDFRFASRQDVENAFDYVGWWQDGFLPPQPIKFFPGADPRIQNWVSLRITAMGYETEAQSYLTKGGMFSLLLSDPCEDFNAGTIPYQDSYIVTLGHIHGAKVIGLEPVDALMTMLNNPQNSDYAAAMITAYGAYMQPYDDPSDRARWMSLYLRGQLGVMMTEDTEYLSGLLGPNSATAIALTNNYLVTQRNETFLNNAMDALHAGDAFIAVGSFHLPGEKGLIAMLRDAGFDVRRITVQGEDEQ